MPIGDGMATTMMSVPKGYNLEHFHVNCNQLWKFSADANAEDVFR
jgi:hypothetical protein